MSESHVGYTTVYVRDFATLPASKARYIRGVSLTVYVDPKNPIFIDCSPSEAILSDSVFESTFADEVNAALSDKGLGNIRFSFGQGHQKYCAVVTAYSEGALPLPVVATVSSSGSAAEYPAPNELHAVASYNSLAHPELFPSGEGTVKEVIVEVEKIVEVEVEKIVEVQVEKIVEVEVEKIVTVEVPGDCDDGCPSECDDATGKPAIPFALGAAVAATYFLLRK